MLNEFGGVDLGVDSVGVDLVGVDLEGRYRVDCVCVCVCVYPLSQALIVTWITTFIAQ